MKNRATGSGLQKIAPAQATRSGVRQTTRLIPNKPTGSELVTSTRELAIEEQRLLWAVRIWVASGRFCNGLTGVFGELGCARALPPLQRLLRTIGRAAARTFWVRHVGCPAVNGDEAELLELLSTVRRGRFNVAAHRLRAILPLVDAPSALLSLRAIADALPPAGAGAALNAADTIPEPESRILH